METIVGQGLADIDFFWSLLDEYAVWDLRQFPAVDLNQVYSGREAVIEASKHYFGTWDDYEIHAEQLVEAGPSVVMAVHERGRGRGSGVPIERRHAQVWTFHRAKLVWWAAFEDMPAALEAIGLSE